MPLFEYECEACGAAFELLVRGAERPACPECQSARVVKRLSVPAGHVAGGRSAGSLPMLGPGEGGCGRPQCGGGRCAGLGG